MFFLGKLKYSLNFSIFLLLFTQSLNVKRVKYIEIYFNRMIKLEKNY